MKTILTLGRLVLLLAAAGLTACGTLNPPKPGDSPEYRPTPPPLPLAATDTQGAIFQAAQGQGLFEDYKARRVGDLLTVVLAEKTDASKSTATTTAKTSGTDLDIGVPSIPGVNELARLSSPLFGLTNTSDRTFEGEGDSSQSNQLSGEITVTVAEVLPNGNLVVQGEKWVGINQGNEFVRLRGIVRPVDISAANSVRSTQVGNAQLYYGGTGAIQDSNAQGWLSRLFNSPVWPL